jgi:NADPH:quinone reductase-like Zn-dependent oxidoreductase
MAGEVIAVGRDVTEWNRGDRVSANFMLDKLHEEQTAKIAASALGGAVHRVLTEYRTFPAHVRFILRIAAKVGLPSASVACQNPGSPFIRGGVDVTVSIDFSCKFQLA